MLFKLLLHRVTRTPHIFKYVSKSYLIEKSFRTDNTDIRRATPKKMFKSETNILGNLGKM